MFYLYYNSSSFSFFRKPFFAALLHDSFSFYFEFFVVVLRQNIRLKFMRCFRPHVADLYVGHRSGVLQVEIHRSRSVKKRSSHAPSMPAIKKNSACMFLKMQMVSACNPFL